MAVSHLINGDEHKGDAGPVGCARATLTSNNFLELECNCVCLRPLISGSVKKCKSKSATTDHYSAWITDAASRKTTGRVISNWSC